MGIGGTRFTIDLFETEELARLYCKIQDTINDMIDTTPINEQRNGYFGGMYIIRERIVKTAIVK